MPIAPLLAALQIALPADSVPGRGAPEFSIPRIDAAEASAIAVDGDLSEPIWQKATRLTGFHSYQPTDGRPADEETEILIWYSPTALYVGVIARDRQPETVRATLAERDKIDREDRVTLYLDTFLDRRRAFVFAVNPLGVQQDGVRSEGGGGGGGTDLNPDYVWASQGKRTEWGWQAELRIPFTSLRYPSSGEQRWGINVSREIQRTGREDVWTDARTGSNSFLGQAATMTGLHDLQRGMVVEAQPFVTASVRGARDPITDRFDHESMETSAGANLRLGFASISLDATVNPDFSQVESDAGLVTANERFSQFVAEQRPFFLEGIELFNAPNRLVHTRRIVDPVAGAKVTGKVGQWGVAYMSALDDQGAGRDDALVNVMRVRRDVGSSSTIGVVATDRRDDLGSSSLLAADTRVVFGGVYWIQAQVGRSLERDESPIVGAGRSSRNGGIYSLGADRTGRNWGFNYQLSQIDDDFEAATGFIPRVGVANATGMNRLTWIGSPTGFVEKVNTNARVESMWRAGEALRKSPLEGSASLSVSPRFRGGWEMQLEAQREFVNFDPEYYEGWTTVTADGVVTPFLPTGGLTNLWDFSARVTTPVFQRVNGSLQLSTGGVPLHFEGREGQEQRIELNAAIRPFSQLRMDLSTVLSRLTRDGDDSEFARTVIPRLKVEYQPTKALFFRTVAEYRAERQAALRAPGSETPILVRGEERGATNNNGLRLEWLASYRPTPGTIAFLGYAVDMTEPSPLAFNDLRARGDGLFVKLAYQFRR